MHGLQELWQVQKGSCWGNRFVWTWEQDLILAVCLHPPWMAKGQDCGPVGSSENVPHLFFRFRRSQQRLRKTLIVLGVPLAASVSRSTSLTKSSPCVVPAMGRQGHSMGLTSWPQHHPPPSSGSLGHAPEGGLKSKHQTRPLRLLLWCSQLEVVGLWWNCTSWAKRHNRRLS